jgi:Ran GTPase-activating protein (RanGAP) involved in mRNA processing and transport
MIPFWLIEQCDRLRSKDERLTNLNLNIRRLDGFMIQALFTALHHNRSLRILNLTSALMHNPLAINGLAEIIKRNDTSLQVLHLSYNRLSDITQLADAVATNDTLMELHLDYNQIHAPSALALARALQHNSTLRILKLNHNAVGDEGCCALAQHALASNTTLRTLGLRSNHITEHGCVALRHVLLAQNVSIHCIDLEQNEMSDSSKDYVTTLCRANAHGRDYLHNGVLPMAYWPWILERMRHDPSLLFLFLNSKPDLFFADHGSDVENDSDDMSLECFSSTTPAI